MVKEKAFFIYLSLETRIRVRIARERRNVVDFVVQLEVEAKHGEWKAVVRYNYAHGFPHRDLIHANGTEEKETIPIKDLDKVVVYAINDLKQKWEVYVRRSGYA
ncbi:MAG: hypothetical protein AOA66_0048 [Candidatus Bathyarchaeota archaeon BA2]|nr:MAG: hypothetical protein AOA66_0048 [Candidatus Bathyarchaeota archaeon BA2]